MKDLNDELEGGVRVSQCVRVNRWVDVDFNERKLQEGRRESKRGIMEDEGLE